MAKRQFKLNKVSVDVQNYSYYIRGVKKSGKTTLFRDLILELFGTPEKGLLIAIKDEVGYKALDNIQVEHVETWEDFEELVEDLVENKREMGIDFIGLDTVDELVDMAIIRALKLSVIETGKPCKSLNNAFTGYGSGRARVVSMIKDALASLRKCYGMMAIGHTKLRSIKEKGDDGDGYQTLSSNLSADYDGIFSDIFDVIATINVERIIEDGKLARTERFLYFRNDGFIDCGSRFKGLPDRIEIEGENIAKLFVKSIEQGIRASISGGASETEIEKQKVIEVKEREKKEDAYIEEFKASKIDVEKNTELIADIKVKHKVASTEVKAKVKETMVDFSIVKFNAEENVTEGLQAILNVLNF